MIAYRFQLVFSLLQVEMSPDRRVLSGEFENFRTIEVVHQARVNFTGELWDVNEHNRVSVS